jgi:hypothetical protein
MLKLLFPEYISYTFYINIYLQVTGFLNLYLFPSCTLYTPQFPTHLNTEVPIFCSCSLTFHSADVIIYTFLDECTWLYFSEYISSNSFFLHTSIYGSILPLCYICGESLAWYTLQHFYNWHNSGQYTVFYLKCYVSETGFCLRLQVE